MTFDGLTQPPILIAVIIVVAAIIGIVSAIIGTIDAISRSKNRREWEQIEKDLNLSYEEE